MINPFEWSPVFIYPYNLIEDAEGLLPAHHAKRAMEKWKDVPWTILGVLVLAVLISSGGK